LCDCGADVEATDEELNRALHVAAESGHISVVRELIEVRNAAVNARDVDGLSALTRALNRQKVDVADYLILHGGIELDFFFDDDDSDDDGDDDGFEQLAGEEVIDNVYVNIEQVASYEENDIVNVEEAAGDVVHVNVEDN
jgi:ankyrin repeat protein